MSTLLLLKVLPQKQPDDMLGQLLRDLRSPLELDVDPVPLQHEIRVDSHFKVVP